MENQPPIELVLAIILIGYTMILLELGFLATELYFRVRMKRERNTWKTWGVESVFLLDKVAFWSSYIGLASLIAMFGWLFLYDTSATIDIITATYTEPDSVGRVEQYMFVAAPFSIPFLGWLLYMLRVSGPQTKLAAVTRLRPIFREKLGVTVISAVYEYSRYAPESFWEDFANWTDEEISQEATLRHIEWARPYSASKNLSVTAWMLIVAIAAVLVSIALFVIGASSFSGLQ